jgi:hypothetical protein
MNEFLVGLNAKGLIGLPPDVRCHVDPFGYRLSQVTLSFLCPAAYIMREFGLQGEPHPR